MINKPFIQLILIHVREFYREPAVLFWSFLFPILMAWGLGIAFNKKPEVTKTIAVVLNEKQSVEIFEKEISKVRFENKLDSISNTYYYSFSYGNENMGITHFKLKPVNQQEAELMVKRGNASMIISTNEDKIQYNFDNHNSDAQLSYLQLSSIFYGENLSVKQAEIKPITEKGTRYIDFLIPGLIAMNVMMSTMWGVSYTLIEARTKKLLRRMVATPMKRWEYIFSHIVARIVLCFVEAAIIFSFAYYYFDLTIEGSVLAFIVLFISGILAFSGVSVLMASRTAKTQVGNGLINLIVMPMMLLSGIYFSYYNFPDIIIPFIQALPLTMLADGIKAIFNESAGFKEVWKYIVILNSLGLVTFILGLRFYKWY
ncbi:MAG: ABC transporter permease [Bacteroidales bacterium]